MARVIGEGCICCGACEATCPMGAISMGEEHMMIDPEKCVDCGACEGVCPMGVISAE